MQGLFSKVGQVKRWPVLVVLAIAAGHLLLTSSFGYGVASFLQTEILEVAREGNTNGGVTQLAEVVPLNCLATNTKWIQCIKEVRSAQKDMTMCRLYKECDHTLADLDGYDATCRSQVSTDPSHRVACCVDVWWTSEAVELRYATATTGLLGGHLSSSCAVNLIMFDSMNKTSHDIRNRSGGLGGTAGPVVIIQHNVNQRKNKLVSTIKNAREAGATRVGVIVLGDEYSQLEPEAYHDSDFLFRNYEDFRDRRFLAHFTSVDESHHMRLVAKTSESGVETRSKSSGLSLGHSYWYPLWYTDRVHMEMSSFTPSRPASARKNLWFFKGGLSVPSRATLVNFLKEDKNLRQTGFLETTKEWAGGGGLGYAQTMLDSSFALAPRGNSHETYRTWEALAFGAIPVLQVEDEATNPFRFFGRNPIPKIKDWAELPALLGHYDQHPEEMNRLQSDCVRWWTSLSAAYTRQIALEVLAGFDSQLLDR